MTQYCWNIILCTQDTINSSINLPNHHSYMAQCTISVPSIIYPCELTPMYQILLLQRPKKLKQYSKHASAIPAAVPISPPPPKGYASQLSMLSVPDWIAQVRSSPYNSSAPQQFPWPGNHLEKSFYLWQRVGERGDSGNSKTKKSIVLIQDCTVAPSTSKTDLRVCYRFPLCVYLTPTPLVSIGEPKGHS